MADTWGLTWQSMGGSGEGWRQSDSSKSLQQSRQQPQKMARQNPVAEGFAVKVEAALRGEQGQMCFSRQLGMHQNIGGCTRR